MPVFDLRDVKREITFDKLQEYLDAEIGWRKQEISYLIERSRDKKHEAQSILLRAAVALLYAHWEGFVKNSAENYIRYVASRKHPYCDLSENFIALGWHHELRGFNETNKASLHNNFLRTVFKCWESGTIVVKEEMVRASSNLNYNIFKEILEMIGLDFTEFELKKNLIDIKLLKRRNEVAHGEDLVVDWAEYKDIAHTVTDMMDRIKTMIENAAISNSYLRNNSYPKLTGGK